MTDDPFEDLRIEAKHRSDLTQLVAKHDALESFAELVRDFFTDDSAGHAMYLKEQAENALAGYAMSPPPTLEGF